MERMLRGVLLLIATTGCFSANLVECPNGTVCAEDKVCDTIHQTCVGVDQVSACDGKLDRDPCEWSEGTGKCFDGVCLAPGCGNHVIESELGETCDDGGHVSGDGCSADCSSTEVCGNGVIDLLEGEACDDGNLRSHDGCDSACQLESPAFTVTPVGIPTGAVGHGAFDEARARFVHVGDGLTWEFDGTHWTIAATTGVPAADWFNLVYDASHGKVAMVGGKAATVSGTKPIDLYLEWNGTAWTEGVITGSVIPQAATGLAAYDRANSRIVVYAEATMWQLSSTTGAWATLALPPDLGPGCTNQATAGGAGIAYDVVRQKLVLVIGGFQPKDVLVETDPGVVTPLKQPPVLPSTWELTGDVWACTPVPLGALAAACTKQTPPPSPAPFQCLDAQQVVIPDQTCDRSFATPTCRVNPIGAFGPFLGAPALIYDGAKVVALGGNRIEEHIGASTIVTFTKAVNAWDGATWTTGTHPLPNESTTLEGGHDTVSNRTYVFGALGDDDLYVLDSTGFVIVPHADPHLRNNAVTIFDTSRDRLVLLQGEGGASAETWKWDGAWTRLTPLTSPPLLPFATMVYHPGRATAVLLDTDNKTYELQIDDVAGTSAWTPHGTGLTSAGATTFDPATGRLLAFDNTSVGSTTPTINALTVTTANGVDTLSWQAIGPAPPTNATSIAYDARNSVLVAVGTDGRVFQLDGTWYPTLTPGDASYAVVADQRRGSIDLVSPSGSMWERVGDNWTEYPALPVAVHGTPHYDPVHGRLVVFGSVGRARVIVTRQLNGTVPEETCTSGVDADGDQRSGCDDDDCFWHCTPMCPPFASCP